MTAIDRRRFLALMALQAAAWSLGCGRREPPRTLPPNEFAGRWMGDDPKRAHHLRDDPRPKWSELSREAAGDVIVIGGGISGLAVAHRLAGEGRRVLVLEQALETGGNAKSAHWGDVEYAIGAAYFTRPDAGDRLDTLYREIGVLDRARVAPDGGVFWKERFVRKFWEGETATGDAVERTRALARSWTEIYETRYPEVPWTSETGWTRAEFKDLDELPFDRHLETIGAPDDVRTFCEYYCWSSFGGSAKEISTYAALNFLTAEFGDILVLPGGNAAIAQALDRSARARGATIVLDAPAAAVRQQRNGVEVAARVAGTWRSFSARACVMAIPRFLSDRLIEDLPPERHALRAGMSWRSYIVANVLIDGRPHPDDWYDAIRIEPLDPRDLGWTDLILADFAAAGDSGHSVLTAYRALPYEGARVEILDDASYAGHRDRVLRDLRPWLSALGLAEREIVDVNLARWGHPLVLAKPGQLARGTMAKLSAPLGRILFAHQDRYGLPAIESALAAAFAAGDETVARLRA